MPTFVVSTGYTGDGFGTALAASGIATRLGTGNVFRVTDNIAIQATVEMHGYTLQFANGFGIYTNTASGYLKGGFKENGNIISPLNLIFEGKSFSAVNSTTDGNSWIRGGSRWETYGLNIIYQKLTDHTDTCFSDNTKTSIQIFEYLSVDVLQPSFDHYFDINFKSGSIISILKLRNSNMRLISGTPTFVSGGYSWLRGQGGATNLKFLSDVQTISGFIPAYPNSTSGVETTSTGFSANSLEFLDSQLDGDALMVHPANNASVNRRIKRTFTFSPSNVLTGSTVTSFSARISSNRQLFGGYSGTAGTTILHDIYAVANGLSQIVEVYHATNHNTVGPTSGGTYRNATVYRLDKEITIKVRKAGFKEYVSTTNSYRGGLTVAPAMTPDLDYSGTSSGISTISTAAQLYDIVQQYLEANLGTDITASRNGTTFTSTHNLVLDASAVALVAFSGNTITLKSSTFQDGLVTTGTITTANGSTITGLIEDSAGVRVTVRKMGGGNFNIAARAGVTGAYTNLGFLEGVSTVTYTVAKGTPIEVAMWSLGCVTYTRTISTIDGGVVFDAEMVVNPDINTTLDVSGYLANIALSIDTAVTPNKFVITFNSAMTVSGIELGKAVVHQLVGRQVALQTSLPPGSTTTIAIGSDEITNNLPAVRLDVGSSLSVTDRVYLDFFVNQAAALLLDSNYLINPPRADGNQVQIFRAKPALDPSVMASAVRTEMERMGGMLDTKAAASALSVLAAANQAEHDATQLAVAAVAALPSAPTVEQIKTALEVNGGKLDRAMQAAISAEDNTV